MVMHGFTTEQDFTVGKTDRNRGAIFFDRARDISRIPEGIPGLGNIHIGIDAIQGHPQEMVNRTGQFYCRGSVLVLNLTPCKVDASIAACELLAPGVGLGTIIPAGGVDTGPLATALGGAPGTILLLVYNSPEDAFVVGIGPDIAIGAGMLLVSLVVTLILLVLLALLFRAGVVIPGLQIGRIEGAGDRIGNAGRVGE